uniref:Sec-independent protein translocase protein TatB n=1 Tax=Candidatus Kentrum sp. LFY TaxID=2126342 RepID=A0A450U572_9GAMM|nr:MAG: sec-independent protein translocase protein TatB [Candidatus Kentron sp. LFY]VFJ89372.1 MAG: sec-independent protein translocase protein TatB [Candidatus Kentron sp. LFY]
MFDIGFWELTIIAIIALLVIGPERLPEFARTTGLWIRKARQFLSGVKNDIDRELRAEDLKRIIKRQEEFNAIHEIIEETQATITDTTNQLSLTDSPMDSPTGGTKSPPSKSGDEPVSGKTDTSRSVHKLDNVTDSMPDDSLDSSITHNGKESTNH